MVKIYIVIVQDVAHIWELGGGSHVSDLVRVPITPDRFHDALYVIVIDLSKPSSAIPHLLHWTDQIKVRHVFSGRGKEKNQILHSRGICCFLKPARRATARSAESSATRA